MNPDVFFKNFELLADAPNGVQKLRELILQLAVMGKLVEQDPNDELASVLLENIKSEKERLFKKGTKSLPAIEEDETPYKLPKEWQWARLEALVSLLGDGLHGTPKYSDLGDYFFINGNNLSDGKILIKNDTKRVSIDEYNKYKKELNERTVLVSINGTLGNVAFYNNENVILGKSACYFNLLSGINKFYLKLLINTSYFLKYAFKNATGTTIKNVSLKSMRLFLVPLPPLAEQIRIVSKVDELMSLCDKLEARRQKKQEIQSKLNSAALDKMLNAENQEEFEQNWQRICENFDLLYDNPENVGKLKQAILQLAVKGKLVGQNQGDEPASVLIERIKKENAQLVKEGKNEKREKYPKITEEEIPYNLPSTWEWTRLRDVSYDWGQKKPDVKFTYIDVAAINQKLGLISEDVKVLNPEDAPSRARKIVKKGTVIYSTVRPYLLNIAIVDEDFDPEPIVSTAFAVLHPFSVVSKKYLYYYLRSEPFISYVESEMNGMAYPAINDTKLYKGLIPLPPLNEQKRIVEKVEQLMRLCDELELKLRKEREDRGKLMEMVVKGLLDGGAAKI